jgi:peptidoglycan/LPS O-acetylase OafA/YrhL
VLTVPGYVFGDQLRENTVIAGVLLLAWLPTLLVPVVLRKPLGLLASASLYIYLTHWLVYPLFADVSPELALLASLAAGVAYWALSMRFLGLVERWLGKRRNAAHTVRPGWQDRAHAHSDRPGQIQRLADRD